MKALLLSVAIVTVAPAWGDELDASRRSDDYQRGNTAGFLDSQIGLPSVPDTGRSGAWQRGYDDGFDDGTLLDPQRRKSTAGDD
jgi:hypothetical protein